MIYEKKLKLLNNFVYLHFWIYVEQLLYIFFKMFFFNIKKQFEKTTRNLNFIKINNFFQTFHFKKTLKNLYNLNLLFCMKQVWMK